MFGFMVTADGGLTRKEPRQGNTCRDFLKTGFRIRRKTVLRCARYIISGMRMARYQEFLRSSCRMEKFRYIWNKFAEKRPYSRQKTILFSQIRRYPNGLVKELEKKTSVVCDDRHAGSNTFVRRHEKCRGLQYYGVVGNPVSTVLF